MSRHRNVRSMNYDDEYEGYDDVYGHSVDDDYCVSPSASQYMYDRTKTHGVGSYLGPEEDIVEEPEEDGDADTTKARERMDSLTIDTAIADLVPEEEILLKSCLEEIHNVVGDSIPETVIISSIIRSKFNTEKALDDCLKGVTTSIPAEEPKTSKNVRRDRETPGKDTPKIGHPAKIIAVDSGVTTATGGIPTAKAEPVKIVPASKSTVTVGFDLPHKERGKDPITTQILAPVDARSNMKSPSPVSPSYEEPSKSSKSKEFKAEAALKEYEKARGGGKDLLNLLVIGHVDAGKSTLMGHLLYQLGQVPQRAMHKFEQESKKLGKQSFAYAWVLDETGEERSRGITMDVGQSRFETKTKSVVLLDAPGHKDFIPNMITGASQADVSVLVVDSTTGEFETGFESGGQTREHALLVRSLGVNQLVVAVNKLDTASWSQERFEDIRSKLQTFLVKQAGFRPDDITFVPCSGLVGENLTKKSEEIKLSQWYTGQTLLEAIDSFRPPNRPVGKPLRLTVNDVFRGPGGLCIGGRLETGMVQSGDKVLIQPIGEVATVKSITLDDMSGNVAFAGDPVLITLLGVADASVISIGFVLTDPNYPIKVSSRIQARIVTFDALSVPITKGFTGVLHIGSMSEQVVVKKLISQLHRGTGEVVKARPRCLTKNVTGLIELEPSKPVCVEEFKDVKELGRFTLRSAGVTIAAGVITKVY